MTPYLLGMLNGWEIVALFVVFFLLFGARKLPGLAKGLGQGIKEFRAGLREPAPADGKAGKRSERYPQKDTKSADNGGIK